MELNESTIKIIIGVLFYLTAYVSCRRISGIKSFFVAPLMSGYYTGMYVAYRVMKVVYKARAQTLSNEYEQNRMLKLAHRKFVEFRKKTSTPSMYDVDYELLRAFSAVFGSAAIAAAIIIFNVHSWGMNLDVSGIANTVGHWLMSFKG